MRDGENLIEVNYFSAYATWLPDGYKRHRTYAKALQEVGVNLVLGQFKDKFLKCRKCGRRYTTKEEEKETDVNIALRLVTDGMLDKYDRAILLTADTDLSVAVDTAHKLSPSKDVFVVAPPGRMRRARGLKPSYELKPGRIAQHLLKEKFYDSQQNLIIERPSNYAPKI